MTPPVFRLFFPQPLVPHYRVPFFSGLARTADLDLEVHAARTMPGVSLTSADVPASDFRVVFHQARALLGGRLLRMPTLSLPPAFGRGDVFVFPGAPRQLDMVRLAVEARRRGAALLWFGQGRTAGGAAWHARARREAMRLFDHVVLYTDAEVALFRSLGLRAERVSAFNNALDQAPIRAAAAGVAPPALAAARAGLDLPPGPVVLFVGRLTAKAQLDLLLDALLELPGVSAVIVGDGECRPELELQAHAIGLADRVRFAGAVYGEPALALLFGLADLFVYPGAIGLSIHHAFGYGLPVVTHGDVAHQMPEFAALRPGENGLVYRRGDARALAATVREGLETPGLRARLSAAARETVAREWSMEATVARFRAAVDAARERAAHR